MQALAQAHKQNNQLTTREFLRSAYFWRFGHDCSDTSLANDAKNFDDYGSTPDYLVKYLIHIYGVQ
jgi:hypothetical protein